MRSILRGENRVTERSKHFFNTVLSFLILFMSIWCQNNFPRPNISETPSAIGIDNKAFLSCPSTCFSPHRKPDLGKTDSLISAHCPWSWGKTYLTSYYAADLCKSASSDSCCQGDIPGVRWPSDLGHPLGHRFHHQLQLQRKLTAAGPQSRVWILFFFPSENPAIYNFP